MASSAPRVASTCAARHAVKRRQSFDERLRLRLRIAIEPGAGRVAGGPPRRFVGVQARERRQPRRMRVGFKRDDLRARQGKRRDSSGACLSIQRERRQSNGDSRRMCIQSFQISRALAPSGPRSFKS